MNNKTQKEHLAGGRRGSEPDGNGNSQLDWEALADEVRELPNLEAQYSKGGHVIAHARIFNPKSGTVWYAAEFDGEDVFFGIIEERVKRLGYFTRSAIENECTSNGGRVQRDRDWKPTEIEKIVPHMFQKHVLRHPYTDGRGP